MGLDGEDMTMTVLNCCVKKTDEMLFLNGEDGRAGPKGKGLGMKRAQ